jgi:NADH-quinone oxidoreductase subunit L
MFVGLSAGAFTGAMFHLTTHAFFKALLFLGAGSVIHALGGEQDIRRMGGLRKKLPATYWTFLAGTVAIAGIPPLSGFFSKDEILLHLYGHSPFMWILAVIGSLMTAFYMFRLLFLAFFRDFRGTEEQMHHMHESPRVMIIPLTILAFLAAFGGLLNVPELFHGGNWLSTFLAPVFADSAMIAEHPVPASPVVEWMLMGITLAGVSGMIIWSFVRYVTRRPDFPGDDARRSFPVDLLSKKYYIDELYDHILVRPVLWLSRVLHEVVEIRFIDRIVNGTGNLVVWTGNTLRYIQTGNVGFYMFIMILGIIMILFFNILI